MILALKYNLPNVEYYFNRLLQIPANLYESMAPFMGIANAHRLESLFIQYVAYARHFSEALLSNNVEETDANFTILYQTAEDIAMFFYELYPSTDLNTWRTLFHGYLDLLQNNIMAIATENYVQDIGWFEQAVDNTYVIGETIANVILSSLAPPEIDAATEPASLE